MLEDTIRQKFLYCVPPGEQEFPPVHLLGDSSSAFAVQLSSLAKMEERDFERHVAYLNEKGVASINIVNDLRISADNPALQKGLMCYILSFAYHYEAHGFQVCLL